jgi:hypothetical protein
MNELTALAETAMWPLVAIVLVLLGATFATSGRPASTATGTQGRSKVGPSGGTTTPDRPRGGRRATDHLPGDRLMVVVSAATVGINCAVGRRNEGRRSVTVVGDAAAARAYTGWAPAADRCRSQQSR